MRQDHAISVEVGHKVRGQGNEDAVVGREGCGGEERLWWREKVGVEREGWGGERRLGGGRMEGGLEICASLPLKCHALELLVPRRNCTVQNLHREKRK